MKKAIYVIFVCIAATGWLTLGPAAAGSGDTDQRNPAIAFFQDHISAADGDRCPMTPSCSSYAARAIQKHGPVMGWIMACDRLVRCGRDEAHISPHTRIKGREYIHDPVAANDFWWFNKEDNK